MKLRLQNYAVTSPIKNSYVIFNNKKLIVYKGITLHKITEFCSKWYSVCPKITSKFQITATFKSSGKEGNNTNKIYRYVHDLSLNKISFV
jgi:hypothetical protein